LLVLAVMVLSGSADPSWTELTAGSSSSVSGPLSQVFQEIISQAVSVVLWAVAALVGIPWLIAAIALAASYLKPHKLT
jgi:hypothetical protein